MSTPPAFWRHGEGGLAASALAPAAFAVGRIAARRAARPGMPAAVPVFCCGNATVGGTGKTILALELLARLRARGLTAHALTRGHGGAVGGGVLRADLALHDAARIGDEALLLAAEAPTWVGADRRAAALAAAAAGADALVMDDGLQNPRLAKDAAFLLVDGPAGFGNGRLLPAGPLREDPRRAAARCRAVVLVGEDRTGAARLLAGIAPVLRATLAPDDAAIEVLRGRRVIAFAGIGRPGKFFDGLAGAGVALADAVPFPDHHMFSPDELAGLARRAAGGAVLATTPKDAVRLPAAFRARVVVVGVRFAWADARLDRILDATLAARAAHSRDRPEGDIPWGP